MNIFCVRNWKFVRLRLVVCLVCCVGMVLICIWVID